MIVKLMSLKTGVSGIRGHFPRSLTPEVCLEFSLAFGTYLASLYPEKKKIRVVVGTDPRKSSELIRGIVFAGLLHTGAEVIDLGIAPTPTVGIRVNKLKADGGIVITASHNPLPWNGLKFMRPDGVFLNESQGKKLLNIYRAKKFKEAKPCGIVIDRGAIDEHLRKVLEIVDAQLIRREKIKVGVDCCNGAGSIAFINLLHKLGCEVSAIHCELTQPFPHPPEPIPENLKELKKMVLDKKLDIGFALDSDADRLAIVSEKGKAIGEELTLVLAAKFVLSRCHRLSSGKKLLVTNLSTTQALEDVARAFGVQVLRTKIGEVHVAEKLIKSKGLIGGEGNGGVIYPKVCYNRDSLTAAALVLNFMAASGRSVSSLVQEIPAYHMIKRKVECTDQKAAHSFILRVKNNFKGERLVLTEGVKALCSDGWVHVRASNTEPIIRIFAESRKKAAAQKLISRAAL